MPRYFFDTLDGGRDRDTEGTDLPDRHSARVAAIRLAGEIIRDQPDFLENGHELHVEVRAEPGDLLFTVITRAVDADPIAGRHEGLAED